MSERAPPETILELMRKSRFDDIKSKFDFIDENVNSVIINAKNEDILAVTLSIDNPVNVINVEIVTPEKILEEAFSLND